MGEEAWALACDCRYRKCMVGISINCGICSTPGVAQSGNLNHHLRHFEAEFSNYRPISLLPAISKIFEKVIYYTNINILQIKNYFIKVNMILETITQLNMLH